MLIVTQRDCAALRPAARAVCLLYLRGMPRLHIASWDTYEEDVSEKMTRVKFVEERTVCNRIEIAPRIFQFLSSHSV